MPRIGKIQLNVLRASPFQRSGPVEVSENGDDFEAGSTSGIVDLAPGQNCGPEFRVSILTDVDHVV